LKTAREIVLRPLITEKGSQLKMASNQYLFQVAKEANKIQIKNAVEEIWNVRVTDVRTIHLRGKKKRMGRFEGRRPDWKKAVVTLKQGETIELFEGV
jgi:large subunit ribosomal protein L23